jgi:flap endonuclease-1
MGIRYLNRFLRDNTSSAIKFISLSELSGKKIAVDISIYMHKYVADNCLIENMYTMLSMFRHYNIIPIFVFDGKPPVEKKELLMKRREDKKESLCEYKKLEFILKNNNDIDDYEKQEISGQMDILKRNFVKINKNDIKIVKSLIMGYGATYYDAPGEADEICALLTTKGKVWATLSEDMDMFVYGCPNVIRYLSLLNHTVVLYDMKKILQNLGITQKEFREICILSGTDYNSLNENTKNTHNLNNTLKLFKKYFKEKKKGNSKEFYNWLLENTDYIEDSELLIQIYSMFDLSSNHDKIQIFNSVRIANGHIIKEQIEDILKKDGFIYP